MAYTLPTYNLQYYITTGPLAPADGPTYLGPYYCQKYYPSRPTLNMGAGGWYWGNFAPVFRVDGSLMSYLGSDLWAWEIGYIECPADSGRWFRITSWCIMHEGFPNEYVAITGWMCDNTGRPTHPITANNNFWPSVDDYPPYMGPNPPP